MKVLSLFDGISCGMIALERAGKKVEAYHASEIDKYAIKVSQKNYPSIVRLGNVEQVNGGNYDLLIGGSPCQGFSFAGKQLNFNDPRSKLFFEFVRILKECQKINPNIKFLLENVKMKKEYQDVISEQLGVLPIEINSSLVSAQNRIRLYWTNIKEIKAIKDRQIYLIDILEESVGESFYHSEAAINYMSRLEGNGDRTKWDFGFHSDTNNKKSACLVANLFKGIPNNVLIDRRKINQINPYHGCSTNQPKMQHRIFSSKGKCTALTVSHAGRTSIYPDVEHLIRKITPVECERLQTIPDNYTEGVSNTQRYKMIGNAWTVDVVAHIFRNL